MGSRWKLCFNFPCSWCTVGLVKTGKINGLRCNKEQWRRADSVLHFCVISVVLGDSGRWCFCSLRTLKPCHSLIKHLSPVLMVRLRPSALWTFGFENQFEFHLTGFSFAHFQNTELILPPLLEYRSMSIRCSSVQTGVTTALTICLSSRCVLLPRYGIQTSAQSLGQYAWTFLKISGECYPPVIL